MGYKSDFFLNDSLKLAVGPQHFLCRKIPLWSTVLSDSNEIWHMTGYIMNYIFISWPWKVRVLAIVGWLSTFRPALHPTTVCVCVLLGPGSRHFRYLDLFKNKSLCAEPGVCWRWECHTSPGYREPTCWQTNTPSRAWRFNRAREKHCMLGFPVSWPLTHWPS